MIKKFGLKGGLVLLAVSLLIAGTAFAESNSISGKFQKSAGGYPEAGSVSFTAYYGGDDAKIQVEDMDAPNDGTGYISATGTSRVNPTKLNGDQTGQSVTIWVSYDTGNEAGSATCASVPGSGSGYFSPNPQTLSGANFLGIPQSFAATPGNNQAFISYNQVTGATGYRIYRRVVSGQGANDPIYERVGTVSNGIQTSYLDTTVINGTAYYYIIVATDASRRSGHPNEVSVTPSAAGSIPNITAPDQGTAGQQVTITGSNFGAAQGTGNVYFNGVPASAISSWSDTSITVTINSNTPTGAGKLVVKNNSSLAGSRNFTVNAPDTTLPTSSVTIANGSYGPNTWVAASTINGTASDNVAVQYVDITIQRSSDSQYWTGGGWGALTWLRATGTTTWTYNFVAANMGDGVTYTVKSRATDTSNNPQTSYGSDSYIWDTTAPTISIGAPSTTLTNTGPVTYTITYGGADSVTLATGNITLNKTGTANGSVAVSGSGTTTRTVTISGITGDGTLGITIAAGTASDTAGNTALGAGPSTTFNVDNTVPTITYNNPTGGATTNWYTADPGNIINIDFSNGGSGSNLDYAQYRIGAGAWTNIATGIGGGTYTTDWGLAWASLAEGNNDISIRVADLAGNVTTHTYVANTSGFRFRKDTVGPTMTFTPLNGAINVSTGQSVIVQFNEAMNTGSVTYTLVDTATGTPVGGQTTGWTGTTILTVGHNAFNNATNYTFTITAAKDVAGNDYIGAHTTAFTTAALPGPTITSVTTKDTTDTSGYVYDTIDIKGTNFGGGAGSNSAPANSSVELMAQGGSYVTLPDTGGSDDIVFWWQSTKIQVLVPHKVSTTYINAGTLTVRVNTPNGSVTGTFTVKPKVYSLTPVAGPVGTNVKIEGTGFLGTAASNSVSFNGTNANGSAITQGTNVDTLEVSVPAGATTGQILVSINSQTSNPNYDWGSQDPIIFTVTQPAQPTVTGISPNSGTQGQTLNLTITGTNTAWSGDMKSKVYFSGTGITINSASATNATTLAANISIALNAATGARTVTVEGTTGSVTFTVNAAPTPAISKVYNKVYTSEAWVHVTPYDPTWVGTPEYTLNLIIEGDNFGERQTNGSSEAPAESYVAVKPYGFSSFKNIPDNPASPPDRMYYWQNKEIEFAVPDKFNETIVVAGPATLKVSTPTGSDEENLDIKPIIYYMPGSGKAGDLITISGLAFGTDKSKVSVNFGNITATPETVTNSTVEVKVPQTVPSGQTISVTVTVNGVASLANSFYTGQNNAPVANNVSSTTSKNTAVEITLSATDADGDPLTYSIVSQPSHGTLGTVSGNKVTYTPAADYIGTDSFTYKANDGKVDSNTATVTISISEGPIISSITPSAAPTGTRIKVSGLRFGSIQGSSALVFDNKDTHASYPAEIVSWSDTTIEAIVPRLATAGTYEVKVNRISIAAGTGSVTAMESNPASFQITAMGAAEIATIYPNPFNPNAQSVRIAITNTGGATNIGFYIFDMTAKLVKKEVIATNFIDWDGKDQSGAFVGDGVYILRVINEDTKTLLAKGKILVVKR